MVKVLPADDRRMITRLIQATALLAYLWLLARGIPSILL